MPRFLRLFFTHNTQYLPKEELYAPPLNIRILDKRSFGRMPLVGTHIIKSLKDFHVDPVLSAEQREAVQGRREGKTSSIRSLLSSTHNRWEEKRGRGRRKRREGGGEEGRKKGGERVEEGGGEGRDHF